MEDNNNFAADFSRDSFDADSLSGLHSSWLDDEQLNNLPIMDVFTDVSTSTAPHSELTSTGEAEKTLDPSTADAVLSAALGDHDSLVLDDSLDFSFDTELSPILEPFADAPHFEDVKEQVVKASVAMSPLKRQRRFSKSPRTRSSPMRRTTVMTPRQTSNSGFMQMTGEMTAPLAMSKRPRTRSASWQDQERNTFFTMFKVKWPPTPEGESVPPFSSLLLERFDAISTKVRTKSVMEVRQFYTTAMQNITEMLGLVKNDIDLTNPDQVRIAVWCWRKLMADKKHREE
ncbi:hypothetical protein PHYBOEH_003999 [Phytophthora boehmeriae]|uniref:Uncharacterized protein n=1 Tax=Phytophthora boehmeriae TaxID=109152 RepID=A0A8T1WTP7_9STRA|nr:hypothetical protein PHYBOEH_003999 [Phytophthora boehmeriae]